MPKPETANYVPTSSANSPAPPVTTETPPSRRFRVTWGDKTQEIEAPNKGDAWAAFCDSQKVWPGPKTGKVEEVK